MRDNNSKAGLDVGSAIPSQEGTAFSKRVQRSARLQRLQTQLMLLIAFQSHQSYVWGKTSHENSPAESLRIMPLTPFVDPLNLLLLKLPGSSN
jgi:hypothetical protein